MKHSFFTCALALLAIISFAQNNSLDEAAIKKVIQQQEAFWNKHDWESFTGYFTDDAIVINPVGQFWKTRKDIVEHYKLLNDCCLEPTSQKLQFKNARFLTSDIAIVYIEATAFADRDYDVPFRHYKKGDIDYYIITDLFVKKNNEWEVTSTQVTLVNQIISPHDSSDKN